jgi:hypothetical protein
VLSEADEEAVRAGRKLNFGGILASSVPSECRAKQAFLIRDTGTHLVVEKLIPQTKTGLRD